MFKYTELLSEKETINTKQVFTIKYTFTELVDYFKARLVARGFSQRADNDFQKTFSLTIHYESIRLILAIAYAEDLEVHQADVVTAYPRAELYAEVYICKIDRLILSANKVLQICKAFYRLKQAGCEWYIEACNTLAKFGLQPAFNDPSVFINTDKSLVVELFVDNIIITAKTLDAVKEFKKSFGLIYKIKDLREIYKYLGLTIT